MHDRTLAPRPLSRGQALTILLAAGLLAWTRLAAGTAAAPAAADDGDSGEDPPTAERLAGEDRYETAAEIARATVDDSASAILASGEAYPDALVASYGPGGLDAPLLLSGHATVPDGTLDALADLDVGQVFLMGGEAALSDEVVDELRDEGYEVFRVAGEDRYETAAQTLDGPDPPQVGTLEGDRTALLASGEDFPDALAAGPVAAAADLPLLLTTAERTEATTTAADAMDGTRYDTEIDRVVIVGGPAAVGEDVEAYLRDERGFTVERWHGEDRSATATAVAEHAAERLGFGADPAVLARGDDFADALAASFHAATHDAPVLLTASPRALDASTHGWLADHCPDVATVRALGGPSAISQTVLGTAAEAAASCLDLPEANQDYVISPQEQIVADVGARQDVELAPVAGTGDDLPTPNEAALFPCESVEVREGHVRFADDGEGVASGAGSTDRSHAHIAAINGIEQGTTDQRRDRAITPGQTWTIASDAVDCTVLVAWYDDEGEPELPIDGDGAPTVPFGIAHMEWVR